LLGVQLVVWEGRVCRQSSLAGNLGIVISVEVVGWWTEICQRLHLSGKLHLDMPNVKFEMWFIKVVIIGHFNVKMFQMVFMNFSNIG
jgi:hypothetical protein